MAPILQHETLGFDYKQEVGVRVSQNGGCSERFLKIILKAPCVLADQFSFLGFPWSKALRGVATEL